MTSSLNSIKTHWYIMCFCSTTVFWPPLCRMADLKIVSSGPKINIFLYFKPKYRSFFFYPPVLHLKKVLLYLCSHLQPSLHVIRPDSEPVGQVPFLQRKGVDGILFCKGAHGFNPTGSEITERHISSLWSINHFPAVVLEVNKIFSSFRFFWFVFGCLQCPESELHIWHIL